MGATRSTYQGLNLGTNMSIQQMRDALSVLYSGQKWIDRVKKMSDAQVLAIYNQKLSEGKV